MPPNELQQLRQEETELTRLCLKALNEDEKIYGPLAARLEQTRAKIKSLIPPEPIPTVGQVLERAEFWQWVSRVRNLFE